MSLYPPVPAEVAVLEHLADVFDILVRTSNYKIPWHRYGNISWQKADLLVGFGRGGTVNIAGRADESRKHGCQETSITSRACLPKACIFMNSAIYGEVAEDLFLVLSAVLMMQVNRSQTAWVCNLSTLSCCPCHTSQISWGSAFSFAYKHFVCRMHWWSQRHAILRHNPGKREGWGWRVRVLFLLKTYTYLKSEASRSGAQALNLKRTQQEIR